MNPTRINNYNKFLSTLDNNKLEKDAVNVLLSKFNTLDASNNILKNEDNEKKTNINNFVKEINQKNTEKCCKDPNYYRDIKNTNTNTKKQNLILYISSGMMPLNPTMNSNKFEKKKSEKEEEKEKEKEVEIKETITIEEEINTISDLLRIIERYKYDPSIKYNINIKALHNIKEPLTQLNNMIGLHTLKTNIVDQILYFAQDLHKGSIDFMHTVIYGPPGTGKTEAAKIMGKIYSKLGVLKKETFKKVTRSDLIAGYLGQTALKTQEVIKEALGGVLFIDEAYALGSSEKRDSFAKECIDTLCEALSDNKENLMVIVAGYEKELKDCFFSFNQGLDSRFTWRFKTDDYSAEDLHNIFIKKIKDIEWKIDEKSNISVDWFKKNKEYFKFYGRDIETLLAKCKIAHSKRVFCLPEIEKKKLVLKDLEKGFEIYIKNEEIKTRKDEIESKKQLYNSLYS